MMVAKVKQRNSIRDTIKKLLKHKIILSMLLPAFAYYIIFHYMPMYGVTIAFKEFNFSAGILGSPWVGLKYFQKLFNMPSFREVFRNTLIISTYKLIFTFPAPIILALMLHELKNLHFKKIVQTISYLPHFLSWVVLGGMFIQIFSPSVGPINLILKALGLDPIYFMGDIQWFRSVLVLTAVWKGTGWSSIIYIASLSSINPELYEAANIDGANRFQQARNISIPALYPIISIMLIFAVGSIVNDDFDQVFNMYNDAVYSVGDVLSTYTYRYGLEKLEYSFSTAAGLFKNTISFILIIITNFTAKKLSDYGIW